MYAHGDAVLLALPMGKGGIQVVVVTERSRRFTLGNR